jgi:hypothetical protein
MRLYMEGWKRKKRFKDANPWLGGTSFLLLESELALKPIF